MFKPYLYRGRPDLIYINERIMKARDGDCEIIPIRGAKPGKPKGEYLAPMEHGTIRGNAMHRNRNIPMCDECRAAAADYQRARKRRLGLVRA